MMAKNVESKEKKPETNGQKGTDNMRGEIGFEGCVLGILVGIAVGWITYYIDFYVLPWSTNDVQVQWFGSTVSLLSSIYGVLAGIVAFVVVLVIVYYWAQRKAEKDSS